MTRNLAKSPKIRPGTTVFRLKHGIALRTRRNLPPQYLASRLRPRPSGLNGGADTAAWPKHTLHNRPDGICGLDHVLKHLVDDVFLENTEVAVTEEILLER